MIKKIIVASIMLIATSLMAWTTDLTPAISGSINQNAIQCVYVGTLGPSQDISTNTLNFYVKPLRDAIVMVNVKSLNGMNIILSKCYATNIGTALTNVPMMQGAGNNVGLFSLNPAGTISTNLRQTIWPLASGENMIPFKVGLKAGKQYIFKARNNYYTATNTQANTTIIFTMWPK